MATVTVEEIEPSHEAPEEATEPVEETVEETKEEEAPAPEVTAVEPPAPKKRGRPKAAPKAEPKVEPKVKTEKPKPRGRPKREVVVAETASVEVERPMPTEEEIGEYLRPLLHAYAAHAQMRGRAAKRQHYREIFSRAF